mgnify:CR=1 FL=1
MEKLILWFLRIWRTNTGSIVEKDGFIEFIIKLKDDQYYSGVLLPIHRRDTDNFIKDGGLRPPSEKDAEHILNYCWCVLCKNKGQIFLPKKGFPKEDDSENFFLIRKEGVIDTEKVLNDEFISLRNFIHNKKNILGSSLTPETYYILTEPEPL